MTLGSLVTHLAIGLVVTFGLLAVLARIARSRRSLFSGRRQASIETAARVSVGKSSSIALLRVGSREVLVGVTPQNVTLLAQSRLGELTGADAPALDVESVSRPLSVPTGEMPDRHTPAVRHSTSAIEPGAPWRETFLELLRERTTRRAVSRR